MAKPPQVLTVVMADRTATYISLVHENEHQPWQRRTVQIRLTPAQRDQLRPRRTGPINGKATTESIVDCWLENDIAKPEADPCPSCVFAEEHGHARPDTPAGCTCEGRFE